ncbi:tetratricopeptide repeat protein [Chryseobacterium sp. Tr-659]|uniref:tetratricopeptide repeat protein n=1 Tax=Chryseobacterium sp. Tr-659 TaxID=2608340 RepID=UPI001421D6E6|nr:tetratricopeptide repeat protein [Chryseobacterium sp. Tr-659]NIF07521.1 tetratricopeptide repeat protein [Chryseobacterium sp. Tr-659]
MIKKIIQIIIGVIALGFLIVIIKDNFFTDANTKSYNDGWDAYDKQQYEMAIFNFNHVDPVKKPDVLVGLGSSYLKIGDYKNAIQNLQKAYDIGYGKGTQDYEKVLISLGMSYSYSGDIQKGKQYLEKARQLGASNLDINFKILDSLEQNQKIK